MASVASFTGEEPLPPLTMHPDVKMYLAALLSRICVSSSFYKGVGLENRCGRIEVKRSVM